MLRIKNMYIHYTKLQIKEKLKKVFVPISISVLSLAAYQGYQIRKTYNSSIKLDIPSEKLESGLIKWIDKVHSKVQSIDDTISNIDVLSILFNKMSTIRDELSETILKENNILNRGIQKVKDVLHNEKIKFYNKKRKILKSKIKQDGNTIIYQTDISDNDNINKKNNEIVTTKSYNKKIKLLVMGDSLVSGVGSDHLVLPQIIASILSNVFKVDVEWFSSGIVGGTINDIRNIILPDVSNRLLKDKENAYNKTVKHNNNIYNDTNNSNIIIDNNDNNQHNNSNNCNNNQVEDVIIIVIVICGLNDWKQIFLNFPFSFNYGPLSFLNELRGLTNDIKGLSKELNYPCKIYYPKLPTNVLTSDPNFLLNIKPLGYFVNLLCHIWDIQKHTLAFEDDLSNQVSCIEGPSMHTSYATPGAGNVSMDGIHPTTQGYRWYGKHIADFIFQSINEPPTL